MIDLIIQTTIFIIGTIILYYAGEQDQKTRTPTLLIPALITISLITNQTTIILTLITTTLIFLAPKQINQKIGKADLLLFTNLFILFIFSNHLTLKIIIFITLTLTLIDLIKIQKQTTNMILKTKTPLIYYYAQNQIKITLITALLTIPLIILTTIGAI